MSVSVEDIHSHLNLFDINSQLQVVVSKVANGTRISATEALVLYQQADLGLLGLLASHVNNRLNDDFVYFNRNFHIEPTNICIHNCTFCSYRREIGQEGSWELALNDIKSKAQQYKNGGATEVHITGGVHPKWDINHYGKIIAAVKSVLPSIHVKAFSAVEIDYAVSKAKLSLKEGIKILKDFGLDSIPGGGAEIANSEIRQSICGTKTTWKQWLKIHETAHIVGIPSNATMLYGHIESYAHRVEHMNDIRNLQDRTNGFNCFIPLKFKASNNKLGSIGEVNRAEDIRNYAVTRIFFDNIKHIKAYWPMIGKETAKLSLSFGVDDLDGTIDESTKIYSMAGAEDQKPSMTVEQICEMIKLSGKKPVERDSLYNPIKFFD
jgi:aminodeoxyfutalosine synthase